MFGSHHVTTDIYTRVLIYLKIHLYLYTLFIFTKSLKATKIDRNVSEL
jgi:hypothetical protein